MDRKSEQKRDFKSCSDTDVGVHDYHAGGKRAQLDGLWSIPPEEVVGLPPSRLMTGCYSKSDGEKKEKPSVLDEFIEHGPPLLSVSMPKRVL